MTALAAAVVLTLGVAPPAMSAPPKLEVAELFFELNDTDGDLGIHGLIDGGPYVLLKIEDPFEQTILKVTAQGRLAKQGLTELFFESAEPPFDELPPEKFFHRFPEGTYEIEAITSAGKELESTVELSHVLAAPPDNITVSGIPAAEDCDEHPLPSVSEPVVIDWDPVTESHPTIGRSGEVDIVLYQFFVEMDDVKFGVDLPPSVTQFQVPSEIIALGNEFKFEIIARTATGNNTAIESCFEVEE
ncbi:MAG: hypothetical protein AB1515_08565 [Nitrospirota bacterium]